MTFLLSSAVRSLLSPLKLSVDWPLTPCRVLPPILPLRESVRDSQHRTPAAHPTHSRTTVRQVIAQIRIVPPGQPFQGLFTGIFDGRRIDPATHQCNQSHTRDAGELRQDHLPNAGTPPPKLTSCGPTVRQLGPEPSLCAY